MLRNILGATIIAMIVTPPVSAYIAVPAQRVTLPELMLEFPTVVHITLTKADEDKGAAVFEVRETLSGAAPKGPVRYVMLENGKPIKNLNWKPGQAGIVFIGSPDNRTLSFIGGRWIMTKPDQGWERFSEYRNDCTALFTGDSADFVTLVRTLSRGGTSKAEVRTKDFKGEGKVFVTYDAQFPHRRLPALESPPKEKPSAEKTLAGLKDANPVKIRNAILEWAEAGDTTELTSDIIKALNNPNAEVKIAVVYALGKPHANMKEAIPALTKALNEDDRFVCAVAAMRLGEFGSKAKSAVGALREALKERNVDYDFRPHRAAEAAEAILKISPDGEEAKAALELLTCDKMLTDTRIDSEGTRTAAARALGRSGAAAKPVIDEIAKRLKDDVSATRIAAAEALYLIGADEKKKEAAKKVLLTELQAKAVADRVQAIRACGVVGLKEAKPELEKLAGDAIPEVKDAAKAALK